jgi:hypothetical protein
MMASRTFFVLYFLCATGKNELRVQYGTIRGGKLRYGVARDIMTFTLEMVRRTGTHDRNLSDAHEPWATSPVAAIKKLLLEIGMFISGKFYLFLFSFFLKFVSLFF